MARKAWARKTLIMALSLCLILGIAQTAFASMQYWTHGSRGPLHSTSYLTHGTAGSLHTASNTVTGVKVSSIYVHRDWNWYVEAGWVKSAIPIDGTTHTYTSFMAWRQPGWLSQQRHWSYALPQGEWRYFELNRFAQSGNNYNWRANLAGVYVTNVWTNMESGTSLVVGERSDPSNTNYTRAQNMCYRGTNGSWYMFNTLRVRQADVYGDPGYYGQWGSWYSGKRDFQVNTIP